MVVSVSLMSLMTYYAAYQLDRGGDVALGANIAKLYATDRLTKTTLDAIQCHGGDGYMRNYPVERHMRDSKLIEIGAGPNEILRHLVWRQWLKGHQSLQKSLRGPSKQVRMPREEAKNKILEELAAFYRRHPALYMERDEMIQKLGMAGEDLDGALEALEAERLVALHRKGGGITLIKATYEGLKRAKPQEYYTFFPDFVDKTREIF